MNIIKLTGWIQKHERRFKGSIYADRDTGLITAVETAHDNGLDKLVQEEITYDDTYTLMAGDFNAHSHPEQSLYTDLVDKAWDLPTWCRNTIYKYSSDLTPVHAYLGASRAFARMLFHGVTSVMVSFYCHQHRGNLFDIEVLQAAKDAGIRLFFGRMNYDIVAERAYEAKRKSQRCFYETVSEAEECYLALLEQEKAPEILIGPSVHSIHASTREAIINAINLGNRTDRYVQFHLSEDEGDVALSLNWYGRRPLKFLEGLLLEGKVASLERLVLSDCIWIDDEEREIIKKYNMKVVLNPRMNHRIKAGQADLPKFLESGIVPLLGTDGEASNDDLSITGERSFLKKQYPEIPEQTIDGLGGEGFLWGEGCVGNLEKNSFCDLKILKDGKISEVWVGAKRIIKDDKHIRLDRMMDIETPLRNILMEWSNNESIFNAK